MKIDINCDMGENIGNDEEIMPFVTSVNIACGFHAGDEISMRRTVELARKYGVAIGAHPSWRDREGFGRREMFLPPEEVEALIFHQIQALSRVAKSEGAEMCHVKPHGALYNQAAKDKTLATAIVKALKKFSSELILVGLAGSELIHAGTDVGLKVANEGFPDRNYNLDGTLVSRKQSNATIEDSEAIAFHAIELAQNGITFGDQRICVDTLCLHGDHPGAIQNAKLVRDALEKSGMEISAL